MPEDDDTRYEAVFRERWRDRQSAGARPGELIKQPGWIDAGLVVLGVLLAAGVVAAGRDRRADETLPAVVQGSVGDRGPRRRAPARAASCNTVTRPGSRWARPSSR